MGVRNIMRLRDELESIKRRKARLERLAKKWGIELSSVKVDEE